MHQPFKLDCRGHVAGFCEPFIRCGNAEAQRTLARGVVNADKVIDLIERAQRGARGLGLPNRAPRDQVPAPSVRRRVPKGAGKPLRVHGRGIQGQEGVDRESKGIAQVSGVVRERGADPAPAQGEPTNADEDVVAAEGGVHVERRDHAYLLTRWGRDWSARMRPKSVS